jgi:predicted kinase
MSSQNSYLATQELESRHQPLELVIFIGLQASGKSSFYRRYFARSHELISKDLMRNRKRKSARQERLLYAALSKGHSVVLDNTNPCVEDRASVIEIAKSYQARVVAYYFYPEISKNLERNRARQGRARVPDVAIFTTAKKLREPTYQEGFDEIWGVRLVPPNGFLKFPL